MPLDVKAAVADALLELIRRKDADKITVKDLVEVCGISRQTFYYHFKDKYDVINWIFYSEITPIIGESQSMDSWADALLALCRYLQDNRTLYRKVLHIQGQNSFSECLMDFYVQLTQNLLRNAGGEQFLTRADSHHLPLLRLRTHRSDFQLGQKRHGRRPGAGGPHAEGSAFRRNLR